MPDDDAYSRVSDPQRYAVLHERGRLLVQRVTSVFDLTVEHEDPVLAEYAGELSEVIRLVPTGRDAAPLSIGWTSFPGLVLRFGHGYVRSYPSCGCDACDEDPSELFVELDKEVYGLTQGGFQERVEGETYEWSFDFADGGSSGGEEAEPWQREARSAYWRPWPRKGNDPVAVAMAFYRPVGLPPHHVFAEHIAAFNAHDTVRLLAGFMPDAVWSTGTDRFEGIGALAGLFDDALWAIQPSLTVESTITYGLQVAAELTERLVVDGRVRTQPIAAFFDISDGRIARAKIYREGSADI